MKEHTLDILTAALIKYGTRVFWAAVIVFVGLRIIRIARRAAGQIMDRAGVEITLKKFLDMLLHAVLFGVMVFMAAVPSLWPSALRCRIRSRTSRAEP